jgi:hypothetical protein
MVNRTTAKWIAACAASAAILSACGGNSPDSSTERSGSHLLAESTASTLTNLLKNPGFESNGDSWQLESPSSSIHTYDVFFSGSSTAHSGSYYAQLNGAGFNAKGINQTVTIPSGASQVYLQFWYNIVTMTANSNDVMVVGVTPASGSYVNLATITGASPGSGWQQSSKYDLSAYAGQTVTVRFYSHTESDVGTYFLLDDLVIASDSASQTTSDNTVFTGNRSNYSIVKTASGYTVTDKTGGEATRTLGNVQSLKFNDVTINLGIGDKAQTISSADLNSLIELYVAYLGRIPDADGLSYWIDQFKSGRTLDDIGKSFYDAAVQYPSLTGYSSTMTNADFVTIVYKNVLGRTSVDAEGLNYWTSSLASGAQTRGTLVKTILGSAHTFKGDATYGAVADLLDNKIKVGIAYAVQQGITFNSASDSVSKGIAIAAATTSTSTSAAIGMYGLVDSGLSLAPTCVTNGTCTGSQYTLSPSSLDFGTVNVGECGSKTFSVQSASGSALATGLASTNSPFSISSSANFSVSNGSSSTMTVMFCPTATGTFSGSVSLATAASFSGASTVALAGTAATSSSSSFAGTYTITGGGVSVSFVVNSSGAVTSCSNGTLVVCSGSVSSGGSFTITGNDGQSPVDVTATLKGSINASGAITGTYSGNSVSAGSLSGSFTGAKSGGTTTTPTPPPTGSGYSTSGNAHDSLRGWGTGYISPSDSKVSWYKHNPDGSTGSLISSERQTCGGTIEQDGSFTINGQNFRYEKLNGQDWSAAKTIRLYSDASDSYFVDVLKDGGYRTVAAAATGELWCTSGFYDIVGRFPQIDGRLADKAGSYRGTIDIVYSSIAGTPPAYIKEGNTCNLEINSIGQAVVTINGTAQFTFVTYDRNADSSTTSVMYNNNPTIDAVNTSSFSYPTGKFDGAFEIDTGNGSFFDSATPFLVTNWSFLCITKKM